MRAPGIHIPPKIGTLVSRLTVSYGYAIPIGFAAITLPVFLFIGWFLVHSQQEGATQTLVRATEVQNAGLARTLANAHSDPIMYLFAMDIGDAPDLLPIAIERSGLREVVRETIQDTKVVNVKMYDGNGITLFSLKEEDLGMDISACECFAMALSGNPVSELIAAELHAHDEGGGHNHPNEEHPHVRGSIDLLTTMIRINVLTPDLVASDGVLEIQSDVTSLVGAITATRQDVTTVIGVPLAILYLALVAIVFLGHITILRRDRKAVKFATRAAESEASNRAKSEFLSLMSHELRTPLNAIIGFSQLIADDRNGERDDETISYASTIHDSGQHMLRMISSILDMTALELGELDLDHDVLHLDDIVRRTVANVGPAFDQNLVTLTVHPTQRLEPVLGDREKLMQVFENLLSNAARYTPAGGTVEVMFDQEPGGFVSAAIKDTGVGMTKDQIEQALRPFQINWVGYSRERDGAGLGLTIADKVVASLGGELRIESETDVGTTIIVRLPVCPADRENVTEIGREPVPDDAPEHRTLAGAAE